MSTPAKPLTAQLVDDHALIREGLRRALERSGEFAVVGESGTLAEARARLSRDAPDVLVVDLRLPDGDGLDLVRDVVRSNPGLGVVVLSMYGGDDQLLAAMDAGASAFVSKDAPVSRVVAAARRAAQAPRTFSADGLDDALSRRDRFQRPVLTPREQEVLDLLAEGLGIAGISRRLFISESTTKTHVSKIYDKLGAANRAQAIMAAMRLGLIPAPAGDGPPPR
jgi:DNA-binding NarL/FixJ family response regulator